jgi:outer membrane lipoprotein-sorting protein
MKNILMWKKCTLLTVLAAITAGSLPAVAQARADQKVPPAPAVNLPSMDAAGRLETILARFDAAQAGITTLEAVFDERKELALFKDPVIAAGRFFFATPHQAKWEYLEPESKVFLISDNALMQYFPGDNLVERRDLREANTGRLFKLFGMGQSSADLEDFYVITLADQPAGADMADSAQEDLADTYELILTPRRRMVEKRISRVLIWVGDQDFLPRAMKLEEADGDFTYWHFSEVRINGELAADVFELDLPDDVEVHQGISLFSSSEGSAP